MQLGLSLDAIKEKRIAKSLAKKSKLKEKKEKHVADAPEKENIENSSDNHTFSKKLSKEEKAILLDQALATSKEDIRQIEENELKSILKTTIEILNTIPYEPVKIINFPPDRDPHREPKKDTATKPEREGKELNRGREFNRAAGRALQKASGEKSTRRSRREAHEGSKQGSYKRDKSHIKEYRHKKR